MIEFGHGTHAGLRRTRNEDTYYADAALGLFLVADGMGGHRYGEVAAAMVRDAVVERVSRRQSLPDAIHGTAAAMLEYARDQSLALPMGSTVAALQLTGDSYVAAWVGDSRIYLWQRDTLRQIGHDHSLVKEMIDAGTLDPAHATRYPRRNVITQALGITAPENLQVGLSSGPLKAGMRFLLCSDGLVEDVTDPGIARIVTRNDLAAQECVDHLLLAALDGGGRDNVSCVLVRID